MGVILNYGQIPLVKSRYMKYINNEEHPYGENTIVAIMCYSGYNVEDAVLINKGAVDRGLFRTTYYNMYETREESSKVGGSMVDSKFTNIETAQNVKGTKPGYDYSHLDKHGMIKENTQMDDKVVLMGKTTYNIENPDVLVDSSIYPKKGQLGYVDKVFMTEGEEGFRLAKTRIREERIPAIGDKVGSRCGQKGTIGLIVAEEDMPFTANGQKPDIIINPHAIPSRMTIGQILESLVGKACSLYGSFGDCTAFVNEGPKHEVFGKLLTNYGYHASGSELLYNGMTGEQVDADIYMGPTYYMRIKHMVKDKINYRAQGPRTMLTRQTVQGRANDGGLRIGEMERDCMISHGATAFLQESMLLRGDLYYMAICNKTGMLAIYNETNNLFLSPMADGPIRFTETLDNKMKIENISRYGRDFSIVKVPYAFKLLMQELATMNVQIRIITEDNINQIENMSFSKNMNKLLNIDEQKEISGIQRHITDKQDSGVVAANKEGYSDVLKGTPVADEEFVIPSTLDMRNIEPSSINNVEYEKGDEVHYRTDHNPRRLWFIQKKMPDGEFVISTYDLIDLPYVDGYINDGRTAIVVVTGLELFKKSDHIYSGSDWDDYPRPNEFFVGDNVYYSKDSVNNRIWEIIMIDSNNSWMTTIRSYNLTNIPEKVREYVYKNEYIQLVVPQSELNMPESTSPNSPPPAPNSYPGSPTYGYNSPGSPPTAPNSPGSPPTAPNSPGSPTYGYNFPSQYDPNSPPYSAILGREMTEQEFNDAKSRPRTPNYTPPGSPNYPRPDSPNYPPPGAYSGSPTIIINTGNSQIPLQQATKNASSIIGAVSDANKEDVEELSSLENSSASNIQTLNVKKIIDKGNGNKEISILTDIAEEKKEEDEGETTKKTINM